MPFGIEEAVVGWIVAATGEAAVRRLSDPQRRALRRVVKRAVDATLAEVAWHLGDERVKHLRASIRERGFDDEQLRPAPGTGQMEALGRWIGSLGDGGYLAGWISTLTTFGRCWLRRSRPE